MADHDPPHPELQQLRRRLARIHEDIDAFKPLSPRPPILDSSYDAESEAGEEGYWLSPENIPGLKKLKDDIKIDLGVLDKFLEDPDCIHLPPLSTNAPYVIAVWNEVLCSPAPIVSVFKTFLLNPSLPNDHKSRKKPETRHLPGAKVDVVADNGRQWVRVNTIKNSRLLSEFREIDSYLTGSESDESGDSEWPTLAQKEFDNSVLRMGRSLLAAAEANAVDGTIHEPPRITLRLTRLDPSLPNDDGSPLDPRIAQTINMLRDMGVDVQLGERAEEELPTQIQTGTSQADSLTSKPIFRPTQNINLDLSALIAIISDLTHAPLPLTIEDANRRFVPPQEYREWKQRRMAGKAKNQPSGPKKKHAEDTNKNGSSAGLELDINDLPRDLIKHARALTNQLLQEMGKGLLQEMYDRIQTGKSDSKVVFWTTAEARERCLRIVSKIGGVHEKRRARALFCLGDESNGVAQPLTLEEGEKLYWKDSRFPLNFIPLLPVRILPDCEPTSAVNSSPDLADFFASRKALFGLELAKVCSDILAQETMPHPRALPEDLVTVEGTDKTGNGDSTIAITLGNVDDNISGSGRSTNMAPEIQRARVTTANPRLTAHTVKSLQWGAQLGWTTLTANRSSVKAMLKEVKAARVAGRLAGAVHPDGSNLLLPRVAPAGSGDDDDGGMEKAEIWIIDPRSLAEGMSAYPTATS